MKKLEIEEKEIIYNFYNACPWWHGDIHELITRQGELKEINKRYFKINVFNTSYFITFEPVAEFHGGSLTIDFIYKVYKDKIINNEPLYGFQN